MVPIVKGQDSPNFLSIACSVTDVLGAAYRSHELGLLDSCRQNRNTVLKSLQASTDLKLRNVLEE